jgi:hypothetical protein
MGGLVIRDELMQINQEEVWNSDKIERTEKFIEEFAIGFLEWTIKSENRLGYHEKNKEWYHWHLDKWYKTKELLEIYKKETYENTRF